MNGNGNIRQPVQVLTNEDNNAEVGIEPITDEKRREDQEPGSLGWQNFFFNLKKNSICGKTNFYQPWAPEARRIWWGREARPRFQTQKPQASATALFDGKASHLIEISSSQLFSQLILMWDLCSWVLNKSFSVISSAHIFYSVWKEINTVDSGGKLKPIRVFTETTCVDFIHVVYSWISILHIFASIQHIGKYIILLLSKKTSARAPFPLTSWSSTPFTQCNAQLLILQLLRTGLLESSKHLVRHIHLLHRHLLFLFGRLSWND